MFLGTAAAAVAWGRERSDRVAIVCSVDDGVYWAGDAPMPDDPDLAGRYPQDWAARCEQPHDDGSPH